MDDKVKLIIEIPKSDYEEIKKVGVFTCPRLAKAIREATPLDDVKAEIESGAFTDLEGDAYIYVPYALEILDNIDKNKE